MLQSLNNEENYMYGMKCFTVLRITTEDHVSEDSTLPIM